MLSVLQLRTRKHQVLLLFPSSKVLNTWCYRQMTNFETWLLDGRPCWRTSGATSCVDINQKDRLTCM